MESFDRLYKKVLKLALATAAILLIPLVLTLTGSGVDGKGFHWILSDFVFMGALIFGTGLAYILVTRKAHNIVYRVAVGLALATAFFLVWANAAVGLVGSGPNPANVMCLGVPAVGLIGAVIARFRPKGMARALLATALAQVLVALIALLVMPDHPAGEILGSNGFFIVLFVVSAMLFQYAAQTQSSPEVGSED